MTFGIPMSINVKETRRVLYAYLAVYRRYRQQLQDGVVKAQIIPAKPGYEHAINPDDIHRIGPKLGSNPMSPENYREAFCERVERKVDQLPPYGREIIKRRFLTPRQGHYKLNDLPSDTEVFMRMQRDGWKAESRYYAERKAEAIQMLAESLGIAVYD